MPKTVNLSTLGLTALVVLLAASTLGAIVPPEGIPLKGRPEAIRAPELDVRPSLTHFERGNPRAAEKPGLERFFAQHSDDWEVFWDDRGDRPNMIRGRGIPMVPGVGNGRRAEDFGLSGPPELADLERITRAFMSENADLFRVSPTDLVLRPQGSGNFGENQQLWFVEYQQTWEGIPIEGAIVFFRVNNGNLISFGSERVGDLNVNTHANLDPAEALERALEVAGFAAEEVTELINDGELKIVPHLFPGQAPGHRYEGTPGHGYQYSLVWELVFRRADDAATYKALVDARNGQVLALVDRNDYLSVRGGIYPETSDDAEVTRDFQHVATSGSCTSLDGTYVRINDNCGSIYSCDSYDGSSDNVIDLGTSGGDDCTTPGYGGAGNTHSSRNGHYHLTNVNRVADYFHPSNSWIDGKVTANMNINNTCNAYWNGSTVNFYRSGGGCGNTGEIAAVLLHEWGHGLDANTGGGSDKGSGEAFSDTVAMIHLEESCVGRGFFDSGTCYNCTTCTGVRDPRDFSLEGTRPIASPANVANDSGINCDRYSCPYYGYSGPMGYQGHCESYIASAANWDLQREVGWTIMKELWYDSLTPAKQAYQVVSGGQCNPSASVDGCGSTNWYHVYLDVDDDDGNLSNGTPNACRIWDAFNAHGIACGTRPACSPTYTDRIYPSSSDGSGCSSDKIWFNYYPCGDWKVYDVKPGSWIGIYAYGDSCAGCVLYHIDFQIQENLGWGWLPMEIHNPEPDAKGMVYTTAYRPLTSQVRIWTSTGFYVKVYKVGIPNGGFETGSAANGWLISAAQPFPSITSNDTYVANRGEYSLGNTGSGTFGGSDAPLWGYGKDVPVFDVTSSSKLYFDTYGATYSQYNHYHVKVWFTEGGTETYDTYVCCYNTGIPAGWSQQIFDFPASAEGKSIYKVEVTFHKDHSTYSRYKPTIYIDNLSLR